MNFDTALLLGLSIGPVIYIIITLWRGSAKSFGAFHYADRGIAPSDFIDSTIMYALQVAVISLFATWGFINGLWAMLVPIFWGIGYLIIRALILSGRLDDIILGRMVGTIHHFISQQNRYRYVAVVAALITLLGIAGPAMFEAHFVADLVSRSVNPETVNGEYYLALFVAFLFVSGIYMIYSGFIGVVGTDKIQLAIGYACFSAVFALLIAALSASKSSEAFYIGVICLAFAGIVFISKFVVDLVLRHTDVISLVSTGIGVAAFAIAAYVAFTAVNDSDSSALSFSAFISENFRDRFPLISILSLAIANGLYQLVDVGHWQRLLAVQTTSDDLPKARRTLAVSTLAVGIYSPLTWAIAVMFGITLRYLLPEGDPWVIVSELMTYFDAGGFIGSIQALLFVAALTAIMFSTIDSLISGVAFTVHNDILLQFSDKFRSVTWAKIVTAFLLIGMFYYYLFMRNKTGAQFDAILYFSWSCQIALVPAVISTFVRPSSGPVIVASMIAGCAAATWPFIQGNPAAVFEVSPTFALAASAIVFIVLDSAQRIMSRA